MTARSAGGVLTQGAATTTCGACVMCQTQEIQIENFEKLFPNANGPFSDSNSIMEEFPVVCPYLSPGCIYECDSSEKGCPFV